MGCAAIVRLPAPFVARVVIECPLQVKAIAMRGCRPTRWMPEYWRSVSVGSLGRGLTRRSCGLEMIHHMDRSRSFSKALQE